MAMTLDQLIEKLPPAAKEIGLQYGPAVLQMAAADLKAWLEYVFVGKYTEAYELYLKSAGNQDLLTEWDNTSTDWQAANEKNADRIDLSKQIAFAVCKAMLPLVLAAVGL